VKEEKPRKYYHTARHQVAQLEQELAELKKHCQTPEAHFDWMLEHAMAFVRVCKLLAECSCPRMETEGFDPIAMGA
jgi:hypothetical protein